MAKRSVWATFEYNCEDTMTGSDVVTTPVDYTTMGGMLRWRAVHESDDFAVACGTERRSWSQLNAEVNRFANALLSLGIDPGDNIAIMMANCLEYLDAYLACAKIGVSATPINYQFAAGEVAHVINDSQARLVIHDPAKSSLLHELVDSSTISVNADSLLEVGGDDSAYEALRQSVPDSEPDVTAITGDETFFIGYTSGTTGFPKGCIQKHRSFVDHYRLAASIYPHRPGEMMLIPGPLFHEAPTLFALAHLFMGGSLIVMAAFDAAEALRQIQDNQCTAIGFAVPTMLDRMVDVTEDFDTSTVTMIATDGAPLHTETMQRTLSFFPNSQLHEFYGATELGLAANIEHRSQGRQGSCGRPVPGVSIVVLDENNTPVPAGEKGTVYVTPRLMDGYLGNDEATRAGTVHHNGVEWFTLGDIGILDDGFLYLVDRESHMIISGGENIYPAEIEAALIEHPDIDDIAVVGAPDDTWGETVVAVVVTSKLELSVDDLRSFLDGRIARYKWPRIIHQVSELPRTPSGKIQKHRITLP